MGEGVRAALGGRRRAGGGAGVQPDPVQHEARYNTFRVAEHFQLRSEGGLGHGEGPLLHNSDRPGRVGAELGRYVPEEPSRRPKHDRDAGHGRPPAAPQRAAVARAAPDAGAVQVR